MDEMEQLRNDVREGKIAPERLIDLIASLQQQLHTAQQRIGELEKQLGEGTAAKVNQPFSVRAEEQRQQKQGKKKPKRKKPTYRGRRSRQDKLKLVAATEQVFPAGLPEEECWLSHTRLVWRLRDGQAKLIAYQVFRGPKNQYGQIPGVLGRSEYGLEIVVAIAFQVYVVGLSFDKVCLLMNFFQGLRLRKSQVDALLYRLSQHWEQEFDCLCALLANSAVVHADETSWSLSSVWAFLSEKARLLVFGVPKTAETLKQILDPDTFAGLVISDDAAVYGRFTHSQKCWAHLLRKAIKLTLLEPEQAEYRRLADGLLEIYHTACRVQRDGRLGDAGRRRKVAELDDAVLDLAGPVWASEWPKQEGPVDDYRRLCNEVMRLMLAEELFAFVTAPAVTSPNGTTQAVSGTNNEAERSLRGAAQARVTGRTNKTSRGARRQTVISSVLESLRQYVTEFTLSRVVAEIERWWRRGQSCFAKLAAERDLRPAAGSPLDHLLPLPES